MANTSENIVSWFEIPVTDMERAMEFYQTLLGITLERHTLGPIDMAWFPKADGAAGAPGSLVMNKDWYKPSSDGVLVYFTVHGDLNTVVARAEAAGGKIITPVKVVSPEYGSMATILDSEGNRIALHARK